ncbi:MAG: hypothetical protein K8U03_05890 [Planctomycetia bacterium]|nr:hypothetical protein [Planctomycetia bacterium]
MRPLRPERKSDATETPQIQGSGASSTAACTVACTSEAENVNEGTDSLAALAAMLTGLDPSSRAKLAAMLIGQSVGSNSTTERG